MRRWTRLALAGLVWLAAPAAAYAQASITGVVKDTSGAVLPGVTVETASQALIEKTRTVVTDGTGQYRIENLRPGTYAVTFTLTGFNTVKRDGIELAGTFTATVNADLRVGALEETITVTGQSPTVDVQSTNRQRVLSKDVMDAMPGNRVAATMAALVPGVTSGTVDVGGTAGVLAGGSLTVHGSRTTDVKMLFNGVSIQTLEAGSTVQGVPNMAMFQELVVDTSTISAEQSTGGVSLNLIPKEGGNSISGQMIADFANDSMQGNNFTQALKDRGLAAPNGIVKLWDVNPSFGGPVKKDKLWFFTTGRYNGARNGTAMFYNLNVNNPNAWTYGADKSHPAVTNNIWKTGAFRLTSQLTPRNKLAFGYDDAYTCECALAVNATTAPESAIPRHLGPNGGWTLDYSSPITNRLLLEAVLYHRFITSRRQHPDNLPDFGDSLDDVRAWNAVAPIGVNEQSTNLTYRAVTTDSSRNNSSNWPQRVALSYITGAHAFKFGYINNFGSKVNQHLNFDSPLIYRFNNGVPNRITLTATPYNAYADLDLDMGVFVQDKWTLSRTTVSYAVRYDQFKSSYPEQQLGPGLLVPNRNIDIPAAPGVNWKDVSPRIGVAHDLFGNGKTALKVSVARYVAGQALRGSGGTAVFGDSLNPIERTVITTTRSWNDANRNFVPDCNLLTPAANGECGVMGNTDFGSLRPGSTYDPDILSGWSKRGYNWEFTAGAQQELVPRVSLDVSYFRRVFGNSNVVDNRAVAPGDYDTFSITTPVDARLPGGGGYTVSGLYDLKPAKAGVPADNFITFVSNYGKQIEHFNGLDITLNARPRSGLLLQGGVSTGKNVFDNCEIVAKLPEILFAAQNLGVANSNSWMPQSFCHQGSGWVSQIKFLSSYTIPKIDVQTSATFQSYPGPLIAANYNAPSAVVQPSLGRVLSASAANITLNLVAPGTMYGERRNQLDFRFAKILRYNRTRSTVGLDVYNALNTSPVITQNNGFAVWQRPESILTARFVKISLRFDF